MSSDTCPAFAKSDVPFRQTKKPITRTTNTNEFQIGMSRQNNNCNKNNFEKKLRDPKRKIKAKNKGPKIHKVI